MREVFLMICSGDAVFSFAGMSLMGSVRSGWIEAGDDIEIMCMATKEVRETRIYQMQENGESINRAGTANQSVSILTDLENASFPAGSELLVYRRGDRTKAVSLYHALKARQDIGEQESAEDSPRGKSTGKKPGITVSAGPVDKRKLKVLFLIAVGAVACVVAFFIISGVMNRLDAPPSEAREAETFEYRGIEFELPGKWEERTDDVSGNSEDAELAFKYRSANAGYEDILVDVYGPDLLSEEADAHEARDKDVGYYKVEREAHNVKTGEVEISGQDCYWSSLDYSGGAKNTYMVGIDTSTEYSLYLPVDNGGGTTCIVVSYSRDNDEKTPEYEAQLDRILNSVSIID